MLDNKHEPNTYNKKVFLEQKSLQREVQLRRWFLKEIFHVQVYIYQIEMAEIAYA